RSEDRCAGKLSDEVDKPESTAGARRDTDDRFLTGEAEMWQQLRQLSVAAGFLAALNITPAIAQKPGGILRMSTPDSPASMSIHEESTVFAQRPMMGVFNNLIMSDQHAR